jgi:ADP-heptose:LPS heptosyltransferase
MGAIPIVGSENILPMGVAKWHTPRFEVPWGVIPSYVDKLTVRETASVLKSCRLYIGNDSGLSHLASAVKTNNIAIYIHARLASCRYHRYNYPIFSVNKCRTTT